MNVVFDFGETRHVRIKIYSTANEIFEVRNATYTLKKKDSIFFEEEGSCNIYENIIDIVISPKEIGEYILKITYHVADEVLIENIKVVVVWVVLRLQK